MNRSVNGNARLEDVAKVAGVSKSTVSRILAAGAGRPIPYSEDTQLKVRKVAADLGYKPSPLARGLARTRSGIVGLVIPSIEDTFFPSLTAIIERRLAERGDVVILSNTSGDPEAEKSKIRDLIGWRMDGLIVAPSQTAPDNSIYWDLWDRGTPFVLVDRCFPDTPFLSVTTDDRLGARLAVEHLLSLGRKHIGRAGGPLAVSTNRLRHEGFLDATRNAGLEPAIEFEGPSAPETGREVIRQIVAQKVDIDGLFCFSDPVAVGALDECYRQGIRVPEDLAVIGYADLPYVDMLRTPLSTIRQPRELIAQAAAELLLAKLEGRQVAEHNVVVPVELVVRDSTVRQP